MSLSVNKNSSMEFAKLENTSAKVEAQNNGRTFVVGTKCSSMKQFGFILAAIFSLGLATISRTCRLGVKGMEELKITGLGSSASDNRSTVAVLGSDMIKKIGIALYYQGQKENPNGVNLTRNDVKKLVDKYFNEGNQVKVINFITATIQKAIEEATPLNWEEVLRKASNDLKAMPGYDPKTFDPLSEDNMVLFANSILKYVQNHKDLPEKYRGVMDIRKWDEGDAEKFFDTVEKCHNKLDK